MEAGSVSITAHPVPWETEHGCGCVGLRGAGVELEEVQLGEKRLGEWKYVFWPRSVTINNSRESVSTEL